MRSIHSLSGYDGYYSESTERIVWEHTIRKQAEEMISDITRFKRVKQPAANYQNVYQLTEAYLLINGYKAAVIARQVLRYRGIDVRFHVCKRFVPRKDTRQNVVVVTYL